MYDSIHVGAARHYDRAQRAAWIDSPQPPESWLDRLADHVTLLAEEVTAEADLPVAFGTMRRDGYLDLLFVRPEVIGRGVAGPLLDALEEGVADACPPRFHARASLMARPFLERRGWSVTAEAPQTRTGVTLPAFDMEWIVLGSEDAA
ncbi:GNAT family N-acetyltransferase [Hasllibacter halocynthiae]|nr:GNAT family N-acetyltransferase [Hasllibacter halocynthiae]